MFADNLQSWKHMWRAFGRHGALYGLGEGISKGLIFVFLIALAGILPKADFAYVNLYWTIVGFLTVPFALGVPGALVRFHFTDRPAPVLGTAGLWIVVGSVSLAGLGFFLRHQLATGLDVPVVLLTLALAGAAANALRQGWLSALRARSRSRLFVASHLIEPLLLAAGLALFFALYGSFGFREIAVSYLATLGLIALGGWLWLGRDPGLTVEGRLSRPLLAFSIPLIPHAFAMGGLATFDQIVVQQVLGAEATAVYALAYRCGMAVYIVALGFSGAWGPLLFRHLSGENPQQDLDRLARRYLDLLLMVSVIAAAVFMVVVTWIGDEYEASVSLVPVIVYAYLWFALYTLASAYLIYAGRTVLVAAFSTTAFLLNVGLDYLLVPSYGVAAAAWATVAGYALLFFLCIVGLRGSSPEVKFRRLTMRVLLVGAPFTVAFLW